MVTEVDETENDVPATNLPGWSFPLAAGLLAAGAAFYIWILASRPQKAEFWGQMGNTIAPFSAALSGVALFAVLYALRVQLAALDEQRKALRIQQKELRLQRKELELQRQEFKDSREVLKEQKEQFEKTAKAQEALAESQALLAEATVAAGLTATASHLAHLESDEIALQIALAEIAARGAELAAQSPARGQGYQQAISTTNQQLMATLANLHAKVGRIRQQAARREPKDA